MNLTRDQLDILQAAIRPKIAYLVLLRERMERTGLTGDRLFPLVQKAEDALRSLSVELHYRSVGHGVGRSPDG